MPLVPILIASLALLVMIKWLHWRATPFGMASTGNMAGLRAALDADPSLIRAQNNKGCDLLETAVVASRKEVVEFLLSRGADLSARGRSEGGGTALHVAVAVDSPEMVRLLLARGAKPDVLSVDGLTPLDWALSFDSKTVIDALRAAGSPETVDHEGRLHQAAAAGDLKEVEKLLASGPVDRRDSEGMTALHRAAEKGQAAVVGFLLEKGADPNAMDSIFQSALHFAAAYGDEETVKLLLAKGAKTDLRSIHGETPADVNVTPEVAALLRGR